MQITENFWLHEFTDSQTAKDLGIPNQPNAQELDNIEALAKNILQPLRNWAGKPVHISSGYRCDELNRAVRGSSTSQHVKGEAADIEIFGVDNREVAEWICANCEFDQIILEFFKEEEGINSGWIHVSYSRHRNRGEKLAAVKDGGTRYVKVDNYWDFE